MKSRTVSFEGCEIMNFINLALYCPWIIPFNKGCYQTLSQIPKILNSLFAISMKKLEIFISITNEGIFTLKKTRVIEPIWKLWLKFNRNSFVSYGDKHFQTFLLESQTGSFEECEIRNFINLGLYCPKIILFNKGFIKRYPKNQKYKTLCSRFQ